MNNKIIIIEDEAAIRGFLKINFSRNNFLVFEAGSGEEGIQLARVESPDVALIDVMLPGIDGYEVCSILRNEFPNMGIIMLTAKGQDIDKITGLEKGSDDYVVKPFNPTELILRVKALLRRLESSDKSNNNIIESIPFKIDIYSKRVFKNDVELELTPTEYSLMKVFIQNKGRAFTRDELLNEVWGYNYIGDTKIVDVNIRRLRSKIEDNSSVPKYIETVWGTGYRWNNK
ncbi:response regulator transcription factor [Clostridium oryzae]|uniref:Stage 0 sporulation protein A homolog n=1 Tax=Clostridium oryzae TaxID=1450648 RepID=A0A1V4ISK6_9CLOT|nr:response regulator transcription factor [Clostridium oryzae]OPJ62447.1 alkaline phosphatase synthesis transcriptional regulatory protein PhoP [Clostridium oryzae]